MVLKRKLKKIVNSISIFLIVGCSYYSMAGSIPANINNVYIPLIENDTVEFEISENLTSKITQEIIRGKETITSQDKAIEIRNR